MEGDPLGFLRGIARIFQDGLPLLPPRPDFLQGWYQTANHVIRAGSRSGGLGTLLAGCSYGKTSRAIMYTCVYLRIQKYTIGVHMYTRVICPGCYAPQ